jgi:hypothetical protein
LPNVRFVSNVFTTLVKTAVSAVGVAMPFLNDKFPLFAVAAFHSSVVSIRHSSEVSAASCRPPGASSGMPALMIFSCSSLMSIF